MFPHISTSLTLSSCTVGTESTPTELVVSIAGELDMADADKVAKMLVEAADGTTPAIRIDLSALTFADSSAVKAIVLGAQAAKRRGVAYELVNPNRRILRLLEVTGLAGALNVVRTE